MPNSPQFGVFLPFLISLFPTGPCVHPKEMEKPGLGRWWGEISQLQAWKHMDFTHPHPQEWLCLASSTVGARMRESTALEASLFLVLLPFHVGIVGQEEQEGCYSIPTPGSCV